MNIDKVYQLPFLPEKVFAAWVSSDTVIPPARESGTQIELQHSRAGARSYSRANRKIVGAPSRARSALLHSRVRTRSYSGAERLIIGVIFQILVVTFINHTAFHHETNLLQDRYIGNRVA